VRLTENRRQHEPAERDALSQLREGNAEGYLGHAAREGRLLVADDATQAKERLLADWWSAAGEGNLREVVMLAHRRSDVAELNEGARALVRLAGRLGEQELVAGEREFRAGDRVVCRQNDSALRVCNGTRATVRDVEPVLGIITLQLDGGPIRQVPARYAAEHLEHGYALTGHAAQGASVERAFVLVRAEGALAEWGYVAASRARTETLLYAIGPELVDDAGLARNGPEPAARQLAGALSRSGAEPAALERNEREREAPSPTQVARDRLSREIESRGRLLASARAELRGLDRIGRRRHGPALRAQIDGQVRILADLRLKLRDLSAPELRPRPPAPDRSSILQARERSIRPPLARGMGLER
jgi:hypothetical protein